MKPFQRLSICTWLSFLFSTIIVLFSFVDGLQTDVHAATQSKIGAESVKTEVIIDKEDIKRQALFVDSQVCDYSMLVHGVIPGVEVVLLKKGKPGVVQMAEVLKDRENLDALHIVSHGGEGKQSHIH